jgi:L-fuconolactonase
MSPARPPERARTAARQGEGTPVTTVVDAHFHAWRPARGDYGWLTPALGAICRDVEIADWQRESAPHGVTAGVLVQAAPTEAETDFLLDQAEAHAAVRGVVGWVDLLAPDAPARVERLARRPRLRGLRPMLQDIAQTDWLLQPALEPALAAMAETGLVFDALVQPRHLPLLPAFCARHPRLQVVIDHGAKPAIAQPQWQPWADDLARIARETTAVCKLSGLLTEAGARPARGAARSNVERGAARRWADHLLATFGPQRLLWGSDWPVLELAAGYADWWDDTQAQLAHLSEPDRAAILGGNAARIYRL